MFLLSHTPALFLRCGFALALLQLNVFIACFPPFQTGIWVQTEPTVLVILASAFLTSAWLALGIAKRYLALPDRLPPLVACLLLWCIWQVVCTLGAPLPLRSWFGPPQTGDGTAMSIATALMALQLHVLWQHARSRSALLWVCAVSTAIQCGLHFYYPPVAGNPYMPDRWVPAQWPEYLPFIGGYLWVAAFATGALNKLWHFMLAFAAMAVLLLASDNASAVALFSPALAASALALAAQCVPAVAGLLTPGNTWRRLMQCACVAPLLLVVISPVFPAPGSDENPKGPLAVFSRINEGIGSRMILNRVGVSAMLHEPTRWLNGNGWGTYTDDLFAYGLVDGIHSYNKGQRTPNWFLVEGTSHHSHNQPLEALMALGLPGMLLWYALPILAIALMPAAMFWSCAPMVVGITGLGHFWFQLPQCFPHQSLYYAALFALCQRGGLRLPRPAPRLATAALLLLAPLLGYSACLHWRAMMHSDQLHYALLNGSYQDHDEEWMAFDLRFGGDRWATSARFYSTDATSKSSSKSLNQNILGWYTQLLHVARRAAQDNTIGARTTIVELRLQYYLFGSFDDPLFGPLRREESEQFEDTVIRALGKASLRDDYTAFFLQNLDGFTQGDKERQIRILNRILAVSPDHRGALWVLGTLLMATPGRAELGQKMLRKAIDLHVEHAYPVTESQLKAARAALPPSRYHSNH